MMGNRDSYNSTNRKNIPMFLSCRYNKWVALATCLIVFILVAYLIISVVDMFRFKVDSIDLHKVRDYTSTELFVGYLEYFYPITINNNVITFYKDNSFQNPFEIIKTENDILAYFEIELTSQYNTTSNDIYEFGVVYMRDDKYHLSIYRIEYDINNNKIACVLSKQLTDFQVECYIVLSADKNMISVRSDDKVIMYGYRDNNWNILKDVKSNVVYTFDSYYKSIHEFIGEYPRSSNIMHLSSDSLYLTSDATLPWVKTDRYTLIHDASMIDNYWDSVTDSVFNYESGYLKFKKEKDFEYFIGKEYKPLAHMRIDRDKRVFSMYKNIDEQETDIVYVLIDDPSESIKIARSKINDHIRYAIPCYDWMLIICKKTMYTTTVIAPGMLHINSTNILDRYP